MGETITIKGARLHNLKNLTVSLPKNQLVVLTGLSGSGKSTLAFDILHKEGLRQYMESMGMVSDMSKPPIETIIGLSPTISVDQHITNHSPRSTVGTVTDVYTFLRVLFARLGHRPCPVCGQDVPPPYSAGGELWNDDPAIEGEEGAVETGETTPCPHCGAALPELTMGHFSFNKPVGACPTCTGLGKVRTGNLEKLIDPERTIAGGGVILWDKYEIERYQQTLVRAGQYYGFEFDLTLPIKAYSPAQRNLLLYGVESPQFTRLYPSVKTPETVATGRFEGVVTGMLRRYGEHILDASYREKMEKLLIERACPDCGGKRLRPESCAVTVTGQTILELAALPLATLVDWANALPAKLEEDARLVVEPILMDLGVRLQRLIDVGAGYLTSDRESPSLSAGEAQRLRLAALLGSGLTGVLYVLDEPTIGLHQRDTTRLIKVLRQLRDLGNTVLVIEHDLEMIRAADYVVDMGPGAGKLGGEVVAAGTPAEVSADPHSVTGPYLSGQMRVPVPERRRQGNGKRLVIREAREHNLKGITVELPLGLFIAVSGVSGSGKSSLMFDILDRAARQRFYGASDAPGAHAGIDGWEYLDKIITVDQSALGRTARSNAATYTDTFTAIREAFAATAEAKARKMTAGYFSFNIPGGRCERCKGDGMLTVSMHFLPDVQVRCPVCHGERYRREVLAVKYNGYTISEVLEMTIDEALPLFRNVSAAADRLGLLSDVGLGYLKLGQPATTLSGGEAQRVKLAKELARRATGRTLYLLDEPTTGLHAADVAQLLKLLHRLVDAGNTVVVIEHNLDLIRAADWVIDLGPEGGAAGGQLIAAGTPEQIAAVPESFTGQYLSLVDSRK